MSRENHGDKEFCTPWPDREWGLQDVFGDLHQFRSEILCRLLFEGKIVRKTVRLMKAAMDLEE